MGEKKASLKELAGLTTTAGAKVIKKIYHRNNNINPAIYIGRGKLKELLRLVQKNNVDVIIFDNELSPAQFHNLGQELDIKIIDRTQLILDIFAQHARTRESKIQVELAQLKYMLPKLTGKGHTLSRLAGGIGTRGPGETKLEIDRRRIEKRIKKIKSELKEIKKSRQVQSSGRTDPLIVLVGYTNAGKSSLLNLLTGAKAKVANKLFATLDSTLRKTSLPCGRKVILTDTVGFIKKIPHQLVLSFRSTLEIVKEADIILHIIDASQNDIQQQYKVVNSVLNELDVLDKEIIPVLNKTDLIRKERETELQLLFENSISLSTRTGQGKQNLLESIQKIVLKNMPAVSLEIPYNEAGILNLIYRYGNVYKEKYRDKNILVQANLTKRLANKLAKYRI